MFGEGTFHCKCLKEAEEGVDRVFSLAEIFELFVSLLSSNVILEDSFKLFL
jgi:hypothetical protein